MSYYRPEKNRIPIYFALFFYFAFLYVKLSLNLGPKLFDFNIWLIFAVFWRVLIHIDNHFIRKLEIILLCFLNSCVWENKKELWADVCSPIVLWKISLFHILHVSETTRSSPFSNCFSNGRRSILQLNAINLVQFRVRLIIESINISTTLIIPQGLVITILCSQRINF